MQQGNYENIQDLMGMLKSVLKTFPEMQVVGTKPETGRINRAFNSIKSALIIPSVYEIQINLPDQAVKIDLAEIRPDIFEAETGYSIIIKTVPKSGDVQEKEVQIAAESESAEFERFKHDVLQATAEAVGVSGEELQRKYDAPDMSKSHISERVRGIATAVIAVAGTMYYQYANQVFRGEQEQDICYKHALRTDIYTRGMSQKDTARFLVKEGARLWDPNQKPLAYMSPEEVENITVKEFSYAISAAAVDPTYRSLPLAKETPCVGRIVPEP